MFPRPSTGPSSSWHSHFSALCEVFCELKRFRGENLGPLGTWRAMETHHDLAALAARQYGVVTREQLNRLGYSESSIDRAVASGRLHAWHRSVFAVGHQRLSP